MTHQVFWSHAKALSKYLFRCLLSFPYWIPFLQFYLSLKFKDKINRWKKIYLRDENKSTSFSFKKLHTQWLIKSIKRKLKDIQWIQKEMIQMEFLPKTLFSFKEYQLKTRLAGFRFIFTKCVEWWSAD